jgi:hypothetical protein
MVIGDSVKCNICNTEYRIRYNLGNKFPQTAMFHCKKCGEKLTYGYEKDRNKIIKNMTVIDENLNLTVINLHPELPIDSESQSDPYYFPSIGFINEQMKKGRKGYVEMRVAQSSLNQYLEHWDKIQNDFRYLKESRWPMLEGKYGKNNNKTEKEILKSVLASTRFYLEGKWWTEIYKTVLSELEKAKRYPNFNNLKEFLIVYKRDFLLQKMFVVMKKYRDVETELLPTLLSQKCGVEQNGQSSSPDWSKIEKIYGDFYEIYGDLLLIPTTINNLLNRNNFEKFSTEGFTIAKYEEIDKAGRHKNFIDNEGLNGLADFYDSGIRNSTHHEASTYEIEGQNILMKTGKGGKVEKKIALLDYLIHCNEIYARSLIIFNIMYKIIYS